jgi:hypothetical protein
LHGHGGSILQPVGDGRVIAPQRGQVIGHRMAGDALVVAPVEGRRQAEVRGAGRFPEVGLLRQSTSHSIPLARLVGVVVMFQAYVFLGMIVQ